MSSFYSAVEVKKRCNQAKWTEENDNNHSLLEWSAIAAE